MHNARGVKRNFILYYQVLLKCFDHGPSFVYNIIGKIINMITNKYILDICKLKYYYK